MQAAGLITFVTPEEEADLLRTLGGRVKWARVQRRMSQPGLAAAAGVRQGTIGNLESGLRKKPRELLSIAAALGASPTWLETGKGEWDALAASAANATRSGTLFDELSDDERRLLENFRAMLDDDQKQFSEEISARAAKMRAYTTKVLEKFGSTAKPAKHAADARKTDIARAALDVTEQLRQNALFEGDKDK